MKKSSYINILLIFVIIVIANSFFVLNEKEQAIVTQFGKPVGGSKIDAGLYFKIPLMQTVLRFDKWILQWDGAANEIPTKDNKYIFIDTFARWKISDPLQFYKSTKNVLAAQSRLDDIIDGAVRDDVSNRYMSEIIRSSNRKMGMYDSEVGSTQEEIIKEGARLEIINSILFNFYVFIIQQLNMIIFCIIISFLNPFIKIF